MNSTQRELLSKFKINISGVAKVLGTTRKNAALIVYEIRKKNKEYYSTRIYHNNEIHPLDLAPYFRATKEEFNKMIFVVIE